MDKKEGANGISKTDTIKKINFIVILSIVLLFSVGALLFSLNILHAPETGELQKHTFITYFTQLVFPAFFEIISSPFSKPEMLWTIFPLIFSLLFMEIYFGRWRNEKLGWNSAFANSVILLFVSINLLHVLWTEYSSLSLIPFSVLTKFILVFLIITQAVLLMIVVYLHAFPKNLSFLIASPLTINLVAFLAIILIYANIPFNFPTLISSIMVYLLLLLVFTGIKDLIPPSSEAKHYLKEKEKEAEEQKVIKEALKKYEKRKRKKDNYFKKLLKKLKLNNKSKAKAKE